MNIPLNEFEQHIDEIILSRGYSYFQKGKVISSEEISPGVFEAVIEGSEDYTVRMKILNNMITEYYCSCPLDTGPICKHAVALIFTLVQEELDLKPKTAKTKKNKTSKRKTTGEQVDELLNNISHKELIQFIKEQTETNTEFKRLFLSSFAVHSSNESKSFYSQQIKAILNSYSDRNGFINYSNARYVSSSMGNLLDTAQKHIENKNYKSAVFICCAVMEEMTKALQFGDDSDGAFGGNATLAYDLLYELTSFKLTEEIRLDLFNYCVNSFKKNIFEGWDWHFGIIGLAAELIKTDREAETLLSLLDNDFYDESSEHTVQEIKFKILLKSKGEKEAETFVEKNISNPSFREYMIKKAIDSKDYNKAIKIAQDGISNDKELPGLVIDWYDWLLKIAGYTNDKEKIIEYARFLFLDSNRNKQEYYNILKKTIDEVKWTEFVEGLIVDLTKGERWIPVDTIANIFITEEWWNRLLELLKNNSSLYYIQSYEKHLARDYPNELAELYDQEILKYLEMNVGRNHYQNACRYLRRMIKLGATEKTTKLIEKLKREYPQRRALLEELKRV